MADLTRAEMMQRVSAAIARLERGTIERLVREDALDALRPVHRALAAEDTDTAALRADIADYKEALRLSTENLAAECDKVDALRARVSQLEAGVAVVMEELLLRVKGGEVSLTGALEELAALTPSPATTKETRG